MPNSPQTVHRRARGRTPFAASLLVLVAGACGVKVSSSGNPLPRDLVLAPVPETVQVRPGERGTLHFVLRTPQGVGVPGQRINFVIVDDASAGVGSKAQGATLSTDSAVTDDKGSAQIGVNAGQLAVFRVHGSTVDQAAEAEAVVVVTTAMSANVQIAPFIVGDAAELNVASIDVAFFDNEHCADLSLSNLPAPARLIRTVATTDGLAEFDLVSTVLSHAVVGRARDRRGAVQAQGCVDLPGTALVAGDLVRVSLPLNPSSPSPVGQFDVTSQFVFADPPAAAAFIAAPWIDLQDCPLDPAQLWLDCTMDALSGAIDGDPNDCQPKDGGEGPIGAALAARRGVLLPAASGGASACRGSTDAAGAPSHDALLASLFGAPKPPALVELHAIADDAGHILGALTLKSQLVVTATPMANAFTAVHTLVSAQLGTAGNATFDVVLRPLGLPALQAQHVHATVDDRTLSLDEQGMTLRLGTVARAAFGQLALVRRGLPADTAGALQSLTRLASASLGATNQAAAITVNGCEALDAVLCADIGRGSGCLTAACADGLIALAARLDGGFATADGDGLDLIIESGSVPIIDSHGTGVADRLGDVFGVPAAPGTWSATLRTHAGNQRLSAQWDAFRSGK